MDWILDILGMSGIVDPESLDSQSRAWAEDSAFGTLQPSYSNGSIFYRRIGTFYHRSTYSVPSSDDNTALFLNIPDN